MLFAHFELPSTPAVNQGVEVTDVGVTEHTELWHLRDVLFKNLTEAPKQSHKSAGASDDRGGFSQFLPAFLIFLHFHCVVFIKED